MPTIQQQITSAANQYGVDPALALAVAKNESSFNPAARSPSGAIGVMQLMPDTADWLGVNPYDTSQNIDGGVRYLSQLLGQFGDPATAVAAYNAGPGRVSRGGPLPEETSLYVSRVMADYGGSDSIPTFRVDVWGEPLPSQVEYAGIGSTGTLLLVLAMMGAALLARKA